VSGLHLIGDDLPLFEREGALADLLEADLQALLASYRRFDDWLRAEGRP
jgi:hypothetical protein